MIISLLQKKDKNNIPLTPESVSVLVKNGHTVLIEGEGTDTEIKPYLHVGGYVIDRIEELLDRGVLLVKESELSEREVGILQGEEKIVFTNVSYEDKKTVEKMLKSDISVFHYPHLQKVQKGTINPKKKVEFSNYILPFILDIADKGMKSLVDNEGLRDALLIMHGQVYSGELAKMYNYECHEY